MIPLLWSALAQGADLDGFSHRATVRCPEVEICRVEVPAELVSRGPESLALVDAAGARVPFAMLRSVVSPTHWRGTRLRPTADDHAVTLESPPGLAVPLVRVRFPSGRFQAAARVDTRRAGQTGWTAGAWGEIGAGLIDERPTELVVPDAGADEFRLVFDRSWTALPTQIEVELGLRAPESLAPAIVEAQIERTSSSRGSTEIDLQLPGPATVSSLELDVEGDVFSRRVTVYQPQPGPGGLEPALVASDTVRRLKIGDARIDDVRVDGFEVSTSELTLRTEDDPDPPLQLRAVRATVERRALLVRGGGAFVLYGGASQPVRLSELQDAAPELARVAWQPAEVGAVELNPTWIGWAETETLLDPGAPMERTRFRRARRLDGEGFSLVALPPDLFSVAASDFADVRVLDAQSRQIPFVIHRGIGDVRAAEFTVTTEQQARATVLTITPPVEHAATSGITIRSLSPRFERRVTLYGIGKDGPRVLDQRRWVATAPGPHTLSFDQRWDFSGPMLVEIDHGDDAPIDVTLDAVWVPTAHLLVRLPAGGAELVYGDRARVQREHQRGLLRAVREPGWADLITAPDYDVALLHDELSRRPAEVVVAGPPVELGPTGSTDGEQVLVLASVGLMVAGLIFALTRLLRHPPSPDHGPEQS